MPQNALTITPQHVTERTHLHFIGITRDSQGLVSSSGHGTILNHNHLHPCPLLKATQEGSYGLFNKSGCIQAACMCVCVFFPKNNTHLKLFNGISPFPDDETHFAGWNQDVLAGFVPIPASFHDLTEQPLRLPVGHKQNQDHKGLNMCARAHACGNKECLALRSRYTASQC